VLVLASGGRAGGSTRCTEGIVPSPAGEHEVLRKHRCLSTLATDPPGQLDVLGHDSDTLGVDGAQVGVLK